jgi:hypothetical protein
MTDYKSVLTLPNHKITIIEDEYGVATISISPDSDKVMDATAISHDANDDNIIISTYRHVRVV